MLFYPAEMADVRLIVNADDFGFTRGVNDGIVRGHREGIITATTLMAHGSAFEHAVELAQANPSLDVGVHLVLWPGGGSLPRRLPAFVARGFFLSPAAVEAEFSRQVEKVMGAGLRPSHLDTHKHVHVFPQVMKAVARVAARFRIRWVRRPLFGRQISAYGLLTPDHFLGYRLTGRMTRDSLLAALQRLKPGLTEFMCHPGLYDDELERAPTRLKRQRQIELEALSSPEVRQLLHRHGVELVSFRGP